MYCPILYHVILYDRIISYIISAGPGIYVAVFVVSVVFKRFLRVLMCFPRFSEGQEYQTLSCILSCAEHIKIDTSAIYLSKLVPKMATGKLCLWGTYASTEYNEATHRSMYGTPMSIMVYLPEDNLVISKSQCLVTFNYRVDFVTSLCMVHTCTSHRSLQGLRRPLTPVASAGRGVICIICLHFSICACHLCAGAMLILSVSFQF